MSYDPGPLQRVTPPPGIGAALSSMLTRFQANVADWCDRLRLGEGWDDLQASAIEGTAASALTDQQVPDASSVLYKCFRHDQTNDLTFTKQFKHRWSKTPVSPHIHVMPLSDAAGNLAFSWKYAWLGIGDKLTGYTDMGEVIAPITAVDRYEHMVIELGDLTPPAELRGTSAFLIVYVQRNRSGSDTYNTAKGWGIGAANVALLGFDTHFRGRLFGTRTEYL